MKTMKMTQQQINEGLKNGSVVIRTLDGKDYYYSVKPMDKNCTDYKVLRKLGNKKPMDFTLITVIKN